MTTEKKTKPVCQNCGSEDVLVDAYAAWNSEDYKYEVELTFDEWFCNGCDGTTKRIEFIPVESNFWLEQYNEAVKPS
jgi:hypothetical protein